MLKDNNIYVRVGVVIWKENVDDIEEMIKYLKNLNVDEVCFNWLIKVGRLTENEDVCVPVSRFDLVTSNIQNFKLFSVNLNHYDFESKNDTLLMKN